MKDRKMIKTILTVIMLLSYVAVAYAAEGGEEHGSHLMGLVWQLINFGVLVAFIVWAVKKFDVKGMLQARRDGIQKSIEEARQAREMAEKALAEVEERLKMKDQEIAKIVEAAKASGERERAETEEAGKKMSEMILEQAKTNIQFELDQARAAIKAEAVELAMELAKKKISDRMTPEEQKKLIEESMAKLEGKN